MGIDLQVQPLRDSSRDVSDRRRHPFLAAVNRSDMQLANAVAGWRRARWLCAVLAVVTWAASGWIYLGVVLWLVAGGGWRALQAAAVGAVLGNIVLVSVKRRVRRRRPCDLLDIGEPEKERFSGDRYSFPSGHCVNAFAVATVLAGWAPTLGPVLLAAAALIGASRVALGLHFLTDALAGAALGALAATFSIMLVGF